MLILLMKLTENFNLSENKIDFTLLKSSDLIINGIYEDIGIRMIGDIDYLISLVLN